MSFRSRDVIGRKIVAVNLNRFASGRGGWSFDPEFVLDNGTRIRFSVDEVEDASCYGITPHLVRKKKTVEEAPNSCYTIPARDEMP